MQMWGSYPQKYPTLKSTEELNIFNLHFFVFYCDLIFLRFFIIFCILFLELFSRASVSGKKALSV